MVSSPDINDNIENRPVARQLRYSLVRYMASSAFDPKDSFSFEKVETAFRKTDKTVERQKSIYEK